MFCDNQKYFTKYWKISTEFFLNVTTVIKYFIKYCDIATILFVISWFIAINIKYRSTNIVICCDYWQVLQNYDNRKKSLAYDCYT